MHRDTRRIEREKRFLSPPLCLSFSRGARTYPDIVDTSRALPPVSTPRDEPLLPTLLAEVSASPMPWSARAQQESTPELNPNPYVNRTPDPANRIPHSARFVYARIMPIYLPVYLLIYLPTGLGRCRNQETADGLSRARTHEDPRGEFSRKEGPWIAFVQRTAIVRRYVVNFIRSETGDRPSLIYLLI